MRQEKVSGVLKALAAEFFERESNHTSLITVTNCTISGDLKQATVYFTVLPEDKEEAALNFAKRQRKELRDYVKSKMKMRVLPFLEVEIDLGEKHRQKIDRISDETRKQG